MPETNTVDVKSDKKAPEHKSSMPKVIGGVAAILVIAGAVVGVLFGLGIIGGSPIKGTWVSDWGQYITVTDDYWYSVSSWGSSASEISKTTGKYIIMQNPASDSWNPSKWTKAEYHKMDDGKIGYCSTVYNGESAAAAEDTDTSAIYDTDDAAAGCNGFGHTVLTKYENPILGEWSTNWGAELTITDTTWTSVASYGTSEYTIEAYGASFVLMQNPADDSYNPSKWTLVNFHTVGGGFGFCMSVYNGATSAAALMTDVSAIYDATNATAGCNGFGHTVASPA